MRAIASTARGTNRTSRSPRRKDETVVASQTKIRLTAVKSPKSHVESARRPQPAVDRGGRRDRGMNRDTMSPPTCAPPRSVTCPLNAIDVLRDAPGHRDVAVDRDHLSVDVADDRRVAVEDDGVAHGGPRRQNERSREDHERLVGIASELGERGGAATQHRTDRHRQREHRSPDVHLRPPSSPQLPSRKASASRAGRTRP